MKQGQPEKEPAGEVTGSPLYTKESQTKSSLVDVQKNSFQLEARLPPFPAHSDDHTQSRYPFIIAQREAPRALSFSSSTSHSQSHPPPSHSRSHDRISQYQALNLAKRNLSLTQSASFLPREVSSSFPDILQRTQAWASASSNPSHSLKTPKKIVVSSTSVKAVAFEFERNHIQKARDSVELNLKRTSRSSSRSSFGRWTEVPHHPLTSPNSDSATEISFGSTYYPTSPGNKFFEFSSANATKSSPSEEDVEIISSPNLSRDSRIDMDASSALHLDSSESVFSNQGNKDLKLSMPTKYSTATSNSLTKNLYSATSQEESKDSASQSLLSSTNTLSGKSNVLPEHAIQSIPAFSVPDADDHVSSCPSEASSPAFKIPGHFSADSVSAVEDELDDDWEDAVDEDNVSPQYAHFNPKSINTTLRTYGFAPTSSSDAPESAQPIQELICVEVKRRSLTGNSRSSPYPSSSTQSQRSKPRNSVVSMLSIASRSSVVSLGATDDGGEFEDADDQAEWMDIDGGGAYEDLDKAQEITREVSRQLIIDSAHALQKATEARNRYSALTEAYHGNDPILFTPMAGPLTKRTSTQVPKGYFNSRDSFISSSAKSGRGSRLSDQCDCEVHDRCSCSSPSSQQRDSTSSRGSQSSRVMLFTRRNSKPTWASRSEETGELGPIVEVENGSDEHTRALAGSPSTFENSSSQAAVDPLTGQPRWRPRPLFLKPAKVESSPGPTRRPINESSSGMSSDNDPTNGKRLAGQHRQLSKSPSFYSAKESAVHGSAPSPRPNSSESVATSVSHETATTHSEVTWPHPPPSSTGSSFPSNVRLTPSSQDTQNRFSPGRKICLSANQHSRPHTANVISNPSRPFGASPPATLRRLQSLSSDRLPLTNLKDRKPMKYSTRSNSRAGHQYGRSKSLRTQQKNKIDLSVLSTIVDSEARVVLAGSNTILDASSVAHGLLSRSGSTDLLVGPFMETDEQGARIKSRKNILRINTAGNPSAGWTVCDQESLSTEDLDPFARVPGVLVRPNTANPIRGTTSSTSSEDTHKGERRSLTRAASNGSPSEGLDKKPSASTTNLRESPTGGYRPDSSSTDDTGQCFESGSEDLSRPTFPTRPARPLRMDEDRSAAQEELLDVLTIPPRERSQTFGRHPRNHASPKPPGMILKPEEYVELSIPTGQTFGRYPRINTSQKPPVMILKPEESVELPLPTGYSTGRAGVEDPIKHHIDIHKALPVSPNSSVTLGPGREEVPTKSSVSRPSSGGPQPEMPQSPRENAYSPKDSSPSQLSPWPSWGGRAKSPPTEPGPSPSQLSSWPSWAGRAKSPQTEPSPSPTLSTTTSTFTFHSYSRARLYSHGNSTVMESAYEPDHLPQSSSSTPLKAQAEWKKDERSAGPGDGYPSAEEANGMKLFYSDDGKQPSVINFTRESALAKMRLLDVQRDPLTEVEDRRPASFIIGGRTKLISGPIKLDQATQAELLWKMINGNVSSDGRLSFVQKKNKKKRGMKLRS